MENNNTALNGVKKMIADGIVTQEAAEKYFPELKESEDEKILRVLKKGFQCYKNDEWCEGITNSQILAWLEKQGEQKPDERRGMNLVEEKMTPFQREVFGIIDISIEEELGLKQVCNKLLALAYNEIEQKSADKINEYEGLTDFERTVADVCIGFMGKELGWKQYVKDNAENLLKIAVRQFTQGKFKQWLKKE